MKEGKRVWNWLLFFVCAVVLTVGLTAQAACARSVFAPPAVSCAGEAETEKTLIPVGRTVGIKLFSKGVMVVALSEIKTKEGGVWPAKQCGLQEGDIITEIENQPVNSIDEVAKAVRKNGGRAMSIQALRDGRQMAVTAEAVPCMADGTYKLGAWLRDSMAGIGTVTYYDPDNQVFAALGHGINDIDTGLLVPIRSGGILSSSVSAVIKGQKSQPGQLHGTFDLTHDIGTLYANSDCGVLGRAQRSFQASRCLWPSGAPSGRVRQSSAATWTGNRWNRILWKFCGFIRSWATTLGTCSFRSTTNDCWNRPAASSRA